MRTLARAGGGVNRVWSGAAGCPRKEHNALSNSRCPMVHRNVMLPALVCMLAALPAAAQTPAGGEFRVNTYATGSGSQPHVAVGRQGDFIVVWVSQQDGDRQSIEGRRYDAAGN